MSATDTKSANGDQNWGTQQNHDENQYLSLIERIIKTGIYFIIVINYLCLFVEGSSGP